MKILKNIGIALFSIVLCINVVACSDDDGGYEKEAKIIHVEIAGTLPTLMSEEEQAQVTDLTLSGYINGTDVGFIQGMRNLTKADFTNLHIVRR